MATEEDPESAYSWNTLNLLLCKELLSLQKKYYLSHSQPEAKKRRSISKRQERLRHNLTINPNTTPHNSLAGTHSGEGTQTPQLTKEQRVSTPIRHPQLLKPASERQAPKYLALKTKSGRSPQDLQVCSELGS